jgi:HAD superfamily hydrolase (TIGR01509 family)
MPVRAAIFDFNGVLVDDEPIHMRLYIRVLEEEGCAITEAEYRSRYLGMDDRGIFLAALREKGLVAGEGSIARLVERKARLYLEAIEKEARPVPGALELARSCAARFGGRIAVVSGALRQEIELVLRRFGARELFPVVVAQDDMARGKPDPEGFLRGLAALARLDPAPLFAAEVAVVEDSVPGVIAARRAGMRCLAVTTSCPEEALRRAGAGRVVRTLEGVAAADLDALPAPPASG